MRDSDTATAMAARLAVVCGFVFRHDVVPFRLSLNVAMMWSLSVLGCGEAFGSKVTCVPSACVPMLRWG